MVIPVATVLATVNVVLAVTVEDAEDPDEGVTFAVIVVLPTATAVASPEAFTVATAVEEEVHVAWLVTSSVVPSPSVPVALNCCVLLGWMAGFVGESAIETTLFPDTKNLPHDAIRAIATTTTSVAATFTLRTTLPLFAGRNCSR